jgi:hypothetical protein
MRPPIDDATQALVVCCVVQQAVSRVRDFFDMCATCASDEDQRVFHPGTHGRDFTGTWAVLAGFGGDDGSR